MERSVERLAHKMWWFLFFAWPFAILCYTAVVAEMVLKHERLLGAGLIVGWLVCVLQFRQFLKGTYL